MSENAAPTSAKPMSSKLMRGAIWIAIGSLIAAALVCVVWVLIGNQDGIIGRAFLTILLLAAFAGIAIAEASMAPSRPDWLSLVSMISWIIALLVGAVKIWMPAVDGFMDGGVRLFQLLLVVGVLQAAVLHVRLYEAASRRHVTTFTRVIVITTYVLLAGLVGMLVFYLTFPGEVRYHDLYWRIVIALAILVAVGTTLIPLLNALFAPRKNVHPVPLSPAAPMGQMPLATAGQPAPQLAWPSFADGRTPLPALPDGSPDWNAYYTGYQTQAAPSQGFPTIASPQNAAPAAPQAPAVPAAPAPVAAPPVPSAPTQAPSVPAPMPPAPPQPPHSTHPAPGGLQ